MRWACSERLLMQGGLIAAAVVFSGSAGLLLSSSAGLAQSRWQMGVFPVTSFLPTPAISVPAPAPGVG